MLGFLPWERWLHPMIYGPLMTLVSIWVLYDKASPTWWQWLLFGSTAVLGVWGTFQWVVGRRNIFDIHSDERR